MNNQTAQNHILSAETNMRAEIAIIGAGPAGLCAAIAAGRALQGTGQRVLLLEGNPHPGKKLLLSGSGQCNFSNNLSQEDFLHRLGAYEHVLKPAFYSLDNTALASLLEQGGCPSQAREDGKLFPRSLKANDVRLALLHHVLAAGVGLMASARVTGLEYIPEQGFSLMMDGKGKLECSYLIIATGGASYPQTGSDGLGAKLVKALGHHPLKFRSHLASISISNFAPYRSCAGISLPDVELRFTALGGVYKAKGDILITHQGFSGPLILDNSHWLAAGDEIIINWLPDAEASLKQLKQAHPRQILLNVLPRTGLPRALTEVLLGGRTDLLQVKMADCTRQQWAEMVKVLSSSSYRIGKVEGLKTAMASGGGIPWAEVNAKTMQSRLCPGLYFAGEILDYALPTGGFNIQMACATGWLAGTKAGNNVCNKPNM